MDALLEQHEELRKLKESGKNIECVDNIISLLTRARDTIAADPTAIAESLNGLQDPVQKNFSTLRKHIKATSRLHEVYSKELDRFFERREVPALTKRDELFSTKKDLLNKAITMHFLREGQFEVADTFVKEQEQEAREQDDSPDVNGFNDDIELTDVPDFNQAAGGGRQQVSSDNMKEDFIRMYEILDEFKKHNLAPAIEWADHHKKTLDKKGSNLAFELCRLQYLFLFQGNQDNDAMVYDEIAIMRRSVAAIQFAREHFHNYVALHGQEIKELVGAIPFSTNLADSPYASRLHNQSLWDATIQSFTREYCSVLGLSAESPLYIAATAGVISMSTFQKTQAVMSNTVLGGEPDKIMSDVPLPKSFRFHPVFVCPVMKGATTPQNPPALLPCGHVLSQQATELLGRGGNFKCPYCPKECSPNLIRKIII
ncbi:hypothetical protein KEM56_000542 [Ascosphaera pollenicola]|nr:hypothetical protein KEM56_000542 [Ascosphaera pollenicola]